MKEQTEIKEKSPKKILNIYSQLLEVQKEIKPIIEDSDNPFYKSKYADYNSIMSEVKPILNKHGLFIIHIDEWHNDQFCIKTAIFNEDGMYVNCTVPILLKEPNNPQAQGSSITYARRYGLSALLAISTEDDDANTASTNKAVETAHPSAYQPHDEYTTNEASTEELGECPKCSSPLKRMKGVSKKTGHPYNFVACSNWKNCDYKPSN